MTTGYGFDTTHLFGFILAEGPAWTPALLVLSHSITVVESKVVIAGQGSGFVMC